MFQYVDEGRHCREHLHLKCVQCGRIYHLDCHFMDEVRAHLMAEGTALPCNARAVYCTGCAVIARRTWHRPQRKNSLQKNAPAVLTRTKTRDTMQTIKVLTGKSKASGFSYRECGMLEAAQKTKPEEHP